MTLTLAMSCNDAALTMTARLQRRVAVSVARCSSMHRLCLAAACNGSARQLRAACRSPRAPNEWGPQQSGDSMHRSSLGWPCSSECSRMSRRCGRALSRGAVENEMECAAVESATMECAAVECGAVECAAGWGGHRLHLQVPCRAGRSHSPPRQAPRHLSSAPVRACLPSPQRPRQGCRAAWWVYGPLQHCLSSQLARACCHPNLHGADIGELPGRRGVRFSAPTQHAHVRGIPTAKAHRTMLQTPLAPA
jgi:hypothetical protein